VTLACVGADAAVPLRDDRVLFPRGGMTKLNGVPYSFCRLSMEGFRCPSFDCAVEDSIGRRTGRIAGRKRSRADEGVPHRDGVVGEIASRSRGSDAGSRRRGGTISWAERSWRVSSRPWGGGFPSPSSNIACTLGVAPPLQAARHQHPSPPRTQPRTMRSHFPVFPTGEGGVDRPLQSRSPRWRLELLKLSFEEI
jgi:hypothetical protein